MTDEGHNIDYLKELIRTRPASWYPDLLEILVEESYEAGTWGGVTKASDFVKDIEDKLRQRPHTYPVVNIPHH